MFVQAKNVYWAYTDYGVYKYRVVDESRHIWRIYLEQGKFQLAMKHCANQVWVVGRSRVANFRIEYGGRQCCLTIFYADPDPTSEKNRIRILLYVKFSNKFLR
jgi:Pep3/Vps18/deep orange family